MRLRRLSVVAAVVSLVLVVAACGRSAPEITGEQVEAWRALGEEMIPAATEIEFEEDQRVAMFGGGSNVVVITVSFADFADLELSDQAVADFEAAVEKQAPGVLANTAVIYQGAESFEANVSSHLLDNVNGLQDVQASSRIQKYPLEDPPLLWVTPYLFVEDPEVIDPEWLDEVSNRTQGAASEAGGRIDSLVILPVTAVGLDLHAAELEDAMLSVQDLSSFESSSADSGCVQTNSWAYDVSNRRVIVHPSSDPGGACS